MEVAIPTEVEGIMEAATAAVAVVVEVEVVIAAVEVTVEGEDVRYIQT